MRYDQAGAFTGADPVGEPYAEVYRAAVRAAWPNAEPFDRWWARHPEDHRPAAVR
jgi:hypothetical protein